MLSRNLKRALLDSRWPLPPPFLLPWAAHLTTVTPATDPHDIPIPPPPRLPKAKPIRQRKAEISPPYDALGAISTRPPTTADNALPPPHATSSPPALSSSVRDLLPLLKAQAPHYITLHIHGKPYLLTQGDTLRLPFLMHGVEPGDVLRLNRAINIGSREYTLKAAAAPPKLKSTTTDTRSVVDPTTGTQITLNRGMPDGEQAPLAQPGVTYAPHFVPHLEKGKHSYLDERLFVCRAVVMGVESEPLRVIEKTKRRQRRVKRVKSKMRFTVLRVKEVRVRDLEEVEAMGSEGVA